MNSHVKNVLSSLSACSYNAYLKLYGASVGIATGPLSSIIIGVPISSAAQWTLQQLEG